MRLGGKVCESVHFLALAVWLGSLVMAGAVAAQVFPLVKAMDARVPEHGGFTGEQWLLVAGRIGDMVFRTTDIVQFSAVLIAAVTLGLSVGVFGLRAGRLSTLMRALGLGAALLLVAYQLLVLGPAMQRDLRAYWSAAQAGDNEMAQMHREAFDALHPRASTLLAGSAVAVGATLVAGVWSLAGVRRAEASDTAAGG